MPCCSSSTTGPAAAGSHQPDRVEGHRRAERDVPVVSLSVTITETNGDLAIVPKGTGALLASVPNNAASGGNKRGDRAVDFQRSRFDATQVASGADSFIGGGAYNTSSALNTVVVGGYQNTASSNYSAVLGGQQNTASGVHACVPGGHNSLADGAGSMAAGIDASTRAIRGAAAYAAGMFSSRGDAQRAEYVLRRQTSNATPARLSADGSSTTAQFQITPPNNSAYAFSGLISARANSGSVTSMWEIKGAIKRDGSAGTAALVGTPTVTLLGQDGGAAAWAVALTADTTTGCLAITVTGAASTFINWVAEVRTAEVAW
ncbi:hypothetical protein SA496_14095 [Pseudomonas sp. JS3066]|uniref:hypothetical protein n=1 Tax=Pseudomonas sp. JS3066 TaxID=3090665 RepID=UPI002E7B0E6A|nr:hypothetical protein [Pseudomonas sp. JS3066]WVK96236.1 hypothetical protein SA496_14095 [Pseudomonas sp. JS3066]